jgi:hypothetical protein
MKQRNAWVVLGSVLAVVTLAYGVVNLLSLVAHSTRTVDDRFPSADLRELSIDVDNGRARLVASTGDEVEVHARISEGVFDVAYRAEVVGDRLEVSSGCSWFADWRCSVDLTIEVPSGLDVVAGTDNGDLVAEGLDGFLRFSSHNGTIRLNDVRGEISASTNNGDVVGSNLSAGRFDLETDNGTLTLAFDAPPGAVTAVTDNGDVEILLPDRETTYALEASSDNGRVDTPIRTDPRSDRSIRATSDNGDVSIRYGSR